VHHAGIYLGELLGNVANMLDAAAIVGLLAEPHRRQVVAALVLGARSVEEIRAATGLTTRSIGTALARLTAADLVIDDGHGEYQLVGEAFGVAARAAAPQRDPESVDPDAPPDKARVTRAFVRDGRLVSIPSHRGKRRVILDMLAQEFEPGRRYREREVNAILRTWHEDFASLRRYLVDEHFLDRDRIEYWRSGGTVAT